MTDRRSYGDDDLRAAFARASSWRAVLRELGLAATSSSAIRSVRQHADRLGLDHTHFTGQRRWRDDELADAVRASRSWAEVARVLQLSGGSSETALKGHAARLGIDAQHFGSPPPGRPPGVGTIEVGLRHLSRAGPLLAASWFTLCGHDVSWPLEPCRYDLLVRRAAGFERIQVKTTTLRKGRSWVVSISHTRGGRAVAYGPDEIDQFFVIDGELNFFLIPYAAVGGLHALSLSAYDDYRVSSGLSASVAAVDADAFDTDVPPSGTGCAACLADGGWWVHLRRCAACGHVGCCDSSPAQHATAHFRETGHPVVQSFEPGEEWFWDYRDSSGVRGPALAPPTSHPEEQPAPGPAGSVPGNWRDLIH